MQVTLETYKRIFSWKYKFWFRDCVVRNKDVFVFVMEPSYTDEQVREEEENDWDSSLRIKAVFTFVRTFEPDKQWGGTFLQNWQSIIIGAAQKPLNQSINIERVSTYPSFDHKCFVTGSGPAYEDKPLTSFHLSKQNGADGNFLRGHLSKLKALDGYLYACGGGRAIGKRLDKGQWQSLSQFIPDGYDEGNHTSFDDFDGWNESDIYAVGGLGDVWHFNGQLWRQIPFPSNYPLSAVCCGGDGSVYIAAHNGIFMGRDNHWKNIGSIGTDLPIKDMVWYEDKVWCTNDYGLWTISNGRVARADVPDEVSACSGNLSVGDGVLLVAGLYGAVFKENGRWQTIIHFSVMEQLLELERSESQRQ
ncbi:hypothetical protein [Pseudomonas paralcaligenes]|uniref:hypothetical protein n=1 Tax=Pseudomonas paralcaligenes TaxID=2772558 RepID=UPI001C7EE449|nr:hypothetical protein [Pseudomonas paralcaligenes]